MKAWHWCRNDMRTRYTNEPIVVGEKLTVEGPVELCERGLHASEDILDALKYAPGTIICRVELSGRIVKGRDKLVASERRVEWCVDATDILVQWTRECAARDATGYTAIAAQNTAICARDDAFDTAIWAHNASSIACDAACDAATDRYRNVAREKERNLQVERLLQLIEEKRTQ